jgi:hypothetical protein
VGARREIIKSRVRPAALTPNRQPVSVSKTMRVRAIQPPTRNGATTIYHGHVAEREELGSIQL